MEYVEGELLAGQLRAGPLGAPRTADIVAQVTAALQPVHDAGLGYGDIRPEKILLIRGGAANCSGSALPARLARRRSAPICRPLGVSPGSALAIRPRPAVTRWLGSFTRRWQSW